MKACTSFLFALAVGVGSMAAASAEDNLKATRVLAGGRNAPMIVAVAPAKKQSLEVVKVAPQRTEVLAGGRNAPHQARQVTPEFQVAPAVRKHKK